MRPFSIFGTKKIRALQNELNSLKIADSLLRVDNDKLSQKLHKFDNDYPINLQQLIAEYNSTTKKIKNIEESKPIDKDTLLNLYKKLDSISSEKYIFMEHLFKSVKEKYDSLQDVLIKKNAEITKLKNRIDSLKLTNPAFVIVHDLQKHLQKLTAENNALKIHSPKLNGIIEKLNKSRKPESTTPTQIPIIPYTIKDTADFKAYLDKTKDSQDKEKFISKINRFSNYRSTILKITNLEKQTSVLLTSDAEIFSFKRILGIGNPRFWDEKNKYCLVQIPHHGSDDNFYDEFWSRIKSISQNVEAVISIGDERTKHPGTMVLSKLKKFDYQTIHVTGKISDIKKKAPDLQPDDDFISHSLDYVSWFNYNQKKDIIR